MIVLQLLGRNCQEPAQHVAAQQLGGDKPAPPQAREARAALDGENDVIG